MAVQTPEEYYIDEENWGNYQFITISKIMEELMLETTDPDSYLVNVPRHKILKTLKAGIREVNKETRRIVHAIEMTIGETGYIVLPQNYIDWVRVSVIDSENRLRPLDINNEISIARGYLQDHEADILFDGNGEILEGDSRNTYAKSHKKFQFCDSLRGGFQTLDTSKFSRNGEFRIDEVLGTIVFSSELIDQEVVIEYLSDGVDMEDIREEEIKIHKDLRDAIWEYTYAYSIVTRRNVPLNEKIRAKKSFQSVLHRVKVDVAGFDLNKINRVSRTSTKQG